MRHWITWGVGMFGSGTGVVASIVTNLSDYVGLLSAMAGFVLTVITIAIQVRKWRAMDREDKQ